MAVTAYTEGSSTSLIQLVDKSTTPEIIERMVIDKVGMKATDTFQMEQNIAGRTAFLIDITNSTDGGGSVTATVSAGGKITIGHGYMGGSTLTQGGTQRLVIRYGYRKV